jgi:hypothetical protein
MRGRGPKKEGRVGGSYGACAVPIVARETFAKLGVALRGLGVSL